MANLELLGEYSAPDGIINIVGFDATNTYGFDEEGKHYAILDLVLGIDYIKLTKGAYAFAQALPEHASYIPIADKQVPQDIVETASPAIQNIEPFSIEPPIPTKIALPTEPLGLMAIMQTTSPAWANSFNGPLELSALATKPAVGLDKNDEYTHLIAFHKILGQKKNESYPVEIPITVSLPYNPFPVIETGIGAGLDAATLIARMFEDAGIKDAPILKAISSALLGGVSEDPEIEKPAPIKKYKTEEETFNVREWIKEPLTTLDLTARPNETPVEKPIEKPIEVIQEIGEKIKKPKVSKVLTEASAKINKTARM